MTTLARPIAIGEPVPWFSARSLNGSATYSFDIAGGRPVLMLFFGSAGDERSLKALGRMQAHRAVFDDVNASFYGISIDPQDEAVPRIAPELPGVRFFLDYDRSVSKLFGADLEDGTYRAHWLLLDRTLRVVARYNMDDRHAALAHFISIVEAPVEPDWAPVAMIPNVLEPAICGQLIDLYKENGGESSGVMREVAGKTKLVLDSAFKVRRDYVIQPGDLATQLLARLLYRLAPMVKRCFQFEATQVERLLVGCYDAAEGGHFNAHRDDTTRGTAHRRFAVTINLNAEEYEGGDLRFPEFGARTYRAPTGGAVVFSCSLLHAATPVTAGQRFALLPFLYSDADSRTREANMKFLDLEPGVVPAAVNA